MRGHEQIIEARMKGLKPAGMVWVHVGQDVRQQDHELGWSTSKGRKGSRIAMVSDSTPITTFACLDPSESARTADWSWAVGLLINVIGDDRVRVAAAHERIVAAGAVFVASHTPCGHFQITDTRGA